MDTPPWIASALLEEAGFPHGFGTRMGAPPEGLATARQVHGDRLLWVRGGDDPSREEADAIATEEPRLVAVRTADCVPILLADRRRGRVAAIHAGWRGTRARIVQKAVEGLGGQGEDLLAAIGPSIGRCCYEVSAELATDFAAEFGPEVREGRHLDLGLVNRRLLEEAGLSPAGIEALGICTFCDPRFHSYRRDGAAAGRQFSYIGPRSVS